MGIFNLLQKDFSYLCAVFMASSKMKRHILIAIMISAFLCGCSHQEKNTELIHRDFYETLWERFDYVRNDIEIKESTTYDLALRISFTEKYTYNDISLVFTIFDANGTPYRSKGYKFDLKDADGNWKSELKDGCYTFELPINKSLQITDPGTYRFQIEYRMPITPILGVKSLTLYSNK